MEWKNKECHFVGCADRQEQARLADQVASLTSERDKLHHQMSVLQEILGTSHEKTKAMIKDLLDGVKITEEGKVLTMEEMNKKMEEMSKVAEDEKVSEVVQQNLELTKQIHQLTLKITGLENSEKTLRKQVEGYQLDQKVREEKDINLIRETSTAQSKMTDLVKQKDDLELEVKKLENHRAAIQRDIADARVEADSVYKKYEESVNGMKKAEAETEFLRSEFKSYKRYLPMKIKWFLLPRIERALKHIERGRIDKAKVLWVKIQASHLFLSDQEKRLITREYDNLMKKMEGK